MTARFRLNIAADYLLAGGVVAYPTEAVYGIGCLPLEIGAVARILALKGRSKRKGLILVAAEFEQLAPYVTLPGGPIAAEIVSSWPGPVTWILPARRNVPDYLTGGRDTLAVRVTAHPATAELCTRAASPLVSTSANRTGRAPARSGLAVHRQLGSALDHIYVGTLGDSAQPTLIRDAESGRVLRGT
jgi:L-threonylcarbamoyladenylate synthase